MPIKETEFPIVQYIEIAAPIVKMKFVIVAFCLAACAYAASPDAEASVGNYNFENNPDGSFVYGFDSSNGISSQVDGHVETVGKDEVALKVKGSSQYISPEGETVSFSYVADENGYQVQGSHLPTPPAPPAIPEYIIKSIEYIKAHPYEEKPKF